MVASLLLCGLCHIAGTASALDPFRALPAGQQVPAPAFILPDHHGHPMDSADLQGKVVVVRNRYNCVAFLRQLVKDVEYDGGITRVEIACRFIGQQNRRLIN